MKRFLIVFVLLPGLVLAQEVDDSFGQQAEIEVTTSIQQLPVLPEVKQEVPPLPLGQSREHHDEAARLILLGGEFADKKELAQLRIKVAKLRKELREHPDSEEIQNLLNQHEAKISQMLNDRFESQSNTPSSGNGVEKKDLDNDSVADDKPKTDPVAGVNAAKGKENMETLVVIFAIVIVIGAVAAAFFIGRGGSKGLADGNRAQSATFDPHQEMLCGSFEIRTTRDGSIVKGKSNEACQTDADTANARAVQARERSEERRAALAAPRPLATPSGSCGANVPAGYVTPEGFTHSSAGERRYSLPELEDMRSLFGPKATTKKDKKSDDAKGKKAKTT